MHVAIKENKYIATKYLDQRQDQDVLPSLCLSENKRTIKKNTSWFRNNPRVQFKRVKLSILN